MPSESVDSIVAAPRARLHKQFIFQVVNALLTQLDKLKHHKNVLVMATSNLAQAIGTYCHSNVISLSDRMKFTHARLCVCGPCRYHSVHRPSSP